MLEARYPTFDGLNLTWETLEGVVKHNGPLAPGSAPPAIAEYTAGHDLELDTHAGAEAQVAALADDIAYNNHDIDDGLRAGLFTVADLAGVPLAGPVFAAVERAAPNLDESRAIHEAVRRMIGAMVDDVIAETRRRLDEDKPASADALRRLGRPVVAFSEAMAGHERALKGFLHEHMYRHPRVTEKRAVARDVVRALFGHFLGDPARLPESWRARAEATEATARARAVADYIAGMTDRFAIVEYNKAFTKSLVI
jgi:dGTPase